MGKDFEKSGKTLEISKEDMIPGHPECHYGECDDCVVFNCPIWLGIEEKPVKPKKDDN